MLITVHNVSGDSLQPLLASDHCSHCCCECWTFYGDLSLSLLSYMPMQVVNQCAFANNCGVPFGALLDYASLAVAPLRQVVGRLPVRCNSCSGFMNIHCKVRMLCREDFALCGDPCFTCAEQTLHYQIFRHAFDAL